MLKPDITIVRGDDYAATEDRAFGFYGTGEGWPDLTGASFSFNIRKIGDDSACLTISVAAYSAATSSTSDNVKIQMTSSETIGLPAGVADYVYDLHTKLPNGNRITLARGFVSVYEDW